jgi:peptide/nickel transport system permease protein
LAALGASRPATVGLTIILVWIVLAILAPAIAPYSPNASDVAALAHPTPSRMHWLGTDHLGRDLMARVIYGARPALLVGFAAVVISGLIGMIAGLVSGYFGGRVDDALMRLADIQLAFPFILLAIAVIGVLGPSLKTIIAVIGVSSWVVYARIVRSAVLSLREREFVQAALALGSGDSRVLVRHILPNALTPWLVVATLDMARVIVIESSLSFLGLGVQPPTPTWGGDAGGRARVHLHRLVAGHFSWTRDFGHCAGDQPVRRWASRYVGPAA